MKKFFLVLILGLFPLWIMGEEVKKVEITISYLEGDVEVFLSGKKDWEEAKLYAKLKEGDRIRVKLQSKAELKLPNGSTINIGENSIMDIKELIQKGLVEKSIFKLWIGSVKAKFQRLKTKDSEAKFYTPTAVMGLRGTTLWLIVDWEGKTRGSFQEGHGYIYTDKVGEKTISEGQEAEVSLEGDITIKALEMKTIPNVVGKSLQDAKGEIIKAGLEVGEIRASESMEPPDSVLSQYPAAGERVLANTRISLVIALPISPCVVPDVIGLLKGVGEIKIKEADLILGVVLEEVSNEPKDTILKQRPNPGTKVKKGSPVDIIISKGPSLKASVPSLIGETIERAKEILGEMGLKLSEIILKEESSIIEEGRITKQDPPPGTLVNLGSFVRVWTAIPIVKEKPPIPTIHYRWTNPLVFVNEIPSLILTITPDKWSPLFIKVSERLTRLERPPYILNFKPPVMRTGVNEINVSCWFENGPEAYEKILSPYYDPLPPKIISVKLKRIEGKYKVSVTVEDRESGINYVKIEGGDAGSPNDYIKEKRAGRDVYIKGTYEKIIDLNFTKPTIPINIEVEDNAGNKRSRIEKIPDVPPSPRSF